MGLFAGKLPSWGEDLPRFSLAGQHGHLDVFKNAQIGENACPLEGPAYLLGTDLIGKEASDGFSLEVNLTGIRIEVSRQKIEKGCFPCAIGANDRAAFPLLNGKRNTADGP
jgi:hypothetical protein